MSKANIEYVIRNNPEINSDKVILCPNCIEPIDMSISTDIRKHLREKYDIPQDKTVFVYGGNLGRPQGIPFIIKCLKKQKENKTAFFLIVGAVTDPNTDVGKVITEGGFGWWCESNNVNAFSKLVETASSIDLTQMKINETKYLTENYTVSMVYENIINKIGG